MAKKDVETAEQLDVNVEVEEKGPGFFQKLLFWFLIPVVFTVAILLIVLQFTNTNVFEIANDLKEKVPFLASETEVIENTSLSEDKIVTLQAEIQEKEAEVAQLQTKIDAAEATNEELLVEQERLTYEIEQLKRAQAESKLEFNEILKTYETMSAKKAAPILTAMKEEEALRIMASMKPNTLTALFEKMDPADAARYTELLAQQ